MVYEATAGSGTNFICVRIDQPYNVLCTVIEIVRDYMRKLIGTIFAFQSAILITYLNRFDNFLNTNSEAYIYVA
jgi:hypothetical protein